jgi:hypothetical protein
MAAMDPRATPVPAAIAALPHDPRGYPIPAITPRDPSGAPTFAITGTARTLVCAAERRCSICGRPMPPGPVWRVIAAAETEALLTAAVEGRQVANLTPSPEPPGHRECMLFAAFTCPFLARPNARRQLAVEVFGESFARGTARGSGPGSAGAAADAEPATHTQIGGALAGFGDYQFSYRSGEQVAFLFTDLVELLPHDLGADQVPALAEALVAAAEQAPTSECPPYLLDDEAAAEAQARAILETAMARHRDAVG